ncbi:CpaD family pilus assembly lipoprotein [Microvirga lotononidis]|uniref:CpaD family pilus assembly lipoprotein n=2 Tax=Microvirga TaxID=186650 RepID=UPI001FDA7BF1|nr:MULTISPECIES: CpaD family pilus assembly lipoprotein [Microvirga]WQO30932.1 CpaD family pilus assembly lipoprotein [Microvirga lotononidis]
MLRIKVYLVGLTAGLSCCASPPFHVEPSAPILIREETSVLTLEGVRASERQRLRVFLERASRGRPDALHLLISGSPRLSAEAVHQAKQIGIDAYNIQLLNQHDGRVARIEAIVYLAHPPVCPSFSSPLPEDESVDQTLGCSTRHNLAVMVNDPRDLFGNMAVKPSDGDRAAIPIAKYREFTTDKSGE